MTNPKKNIVLISSFVAVAVSLSLIAILWVFLSEDKTSIKSSEIVDTSPPSTTEVEPLQSDLSPASTIESNFLLVEPEEPKPDFSKWSSFDQMNISASVDNSPMLSSEGQPGSVRVVCHMSHFNYDDPIVNPGDSGAAHLHMFFGNSLTAHSSTYESLSRSGEGTCQGNQVNRTAYWVPALLDGDGYARVAQYSLIYYKRGLVREKVIQPVPEGLRMVAGSARASSADENEGKYSWRCGFPGNYPKTYGKGKTIPVCQPGDALSLTLVFPQCWDGKNLDSKNHRSHMAHPSDGNCPASHPVAIPEITYNLHWNNSDQSTEGWYLSSDHFKGLDVTGGVTTHADWFGAWHPEVMETLVSECNNADHDCKGGTISPSRRLVDPTAPNLSSGDIYNGDRAPDKILVDSIEK